jgi:hypothetical protein
LGNIGQNVVGRPPPMSRFALILKTRVYVIVWKNGQDESQNPRVAPHSCAEQQAPDDGNPYKHWFGNDIPFRPTMRIQHEFEYKGRRVCIEQINYYWFEATIDDEPENVGRMSLEENIASLKARIDTKS